MIKFWSVTWLWAWVPFTCKRVSCTDIPQTMQFLWRNKYHHCSAMIVLLVNNYDEVVYMRKHYIIMTYYTQKKPLIVSLWHNIENTIPSINWHQSDHFLHFILSSLKLISQEPLACSMPTQRLRPFPFPFHSSHAYFFFNIYFQLWHQLKHNCTA